MKNKTPGLVISLFAFFLILLINNSSGQILGYHKIQLDPNGKILPWFSSDPGESYDHVIRLVWKFWINMETCPNGVPYYLQHQVWKPEHDPRGLGGDQISMALSSWDLLHSYLGNDSVLSNMVLIADFWLNNGLSPASYKWPFMPFPYNLDVHSGKYDGDMRAGPDVIQPDKAASFAAELLTLYKKTLQPKYLNAAIKIADVLVAKITPGDEENSPWPFRVNARTGELPQNAFSKYTANWTGALRLFDGLVQLHTPNSANYKNAFNMLSAWIKNFPLKNNKWGPFFEDITDWSNTEINADTMAWYILENPNWDPNWKKLGRQILDWTLSTFGTNKWLDIGVIPIQEQTAYRVPGNSHTARHASVELIYSEKTGDLAKKDMAIRQLNWATYMVDTDGKNRYPQDDIWLTDGYGDYVRHYLRAMAAAPELAPKNQNHLLKSSSVIQKVVYSQNQIVITTFDKSGYLLLHVTQKPSSILAGSNKLKECLSSESIQNNGFVFNHKNDPKGTLRIKYTNSNQVKINF